MEMSCEASVDVAIVGGGPAGTAAAIEARRRGLRVSLWERDSFPRDKVCGEFISGESVPLLERLIPKELCHGFVLRRCEFIAPGGRTSTFVLPRPALGLSRRCLDYALWRAAAAAGAQAQEGTTVRKVGKVAGRNGEIARWKIESTDGVEVAAHSLILACGRWWMLEGVPSPAGRTNRTRSPWIGIKAHFAGLPARDAVEMYYFRGGYCGLAPVEGGLYNACCLIDRHLVSRSRGRNDLTDFRHWLMRVVKHDALSARLQNSTQASETVATAPINLARQRHLGNGALLAGDAAGFIDPFTGDGISMALYSGQLAVEVTAELLKGQPASPGVPRAAKEYNDRLGHAVGRSHSVAGMLRILVSAPAYVQTVAAAILPCLGPALMTETRWRPQRRCGHEFR